MQNLSLHRYPALELVSYLEDSEADFDCLANAYKSHKSFDESREFPIDFYESTFLTLFVKAATEKIGHNHPELGIKKVILSRPKYLWVPDSIDKFFVYDRDSYQKAKKTGETGKLTPLARYESILTTGPKSTPTIIESSLFRFPRLQRYNGKNFHQKVEILSEETQQRPGFIIVVPEEHAIPPKWPKIWHKYQNNPDYFTACGGLIARLYMSEEDFGNEVRQAVKRHKLKVKKRKS